MSNNQFPEDGSTSPWKITPIADGPTKAQQALNVMHRTDKPLETDVGFNDWAGKYVVVPTANNHQPIIDIGYCRALWDLVCGNIVCDDNDTLYRRDIDNSGANQTLDSWHAVEDIATEYGVTKRKSTQAWNRQILNEARKRETRLVHGVKFNNLACQRNPETGKIDTTKDPLDLKRPYLITVPENYDNKEERQAANFLHFVTADEHSAQNLARMFATPALQPYQHLLYIMSGEGGNGKGVILGSLAQTFPLLAHSVDAARLTGMRNAGFAQENETSELMGRLWVYDTDADTITLDALTSLKKIATGDDVTGRKIGQNEVKFSPKATLTIASNNPVITTMTAASERRYVFIRMRNGRSEKEFQPLIDWIKQHGACGFLMASCAIWYTFGDHPWHDVTIGNADSLSPGEQWIVDEITDHGYAVSGDNPYRMNPSDFRNAAAKLGLQSTRKTVEGDRQRVLIVKSELRFHPYRQASAQDSQTGDIAPIPKPIDDTQNLDPTDFGFPCDMWPADQKKVSHFWKKNTAKQDDTTAHRPQNEKAWACIPRKGGVILDMDVPDDGSTTGWQTLNNQLGMYGSLAFPNTLLVRTPHGGVHAYYRIPPKLQGKIRDINHINGDPVDVRAERQGYVIAPNSQIAIGSYKIIDVPNGDNVPYLSKEQITWIGNHGGIEGVKAIPKMLVTPENWKQYPPTKPIDLPKQGTPTFADLMRYNNATGDHKPDISKIPKGERNVVLHAWCYGRVKHYPNNLQGIYTDLYMRARISGLPDSETENIWRSVMRRMAIEKGQTK